MYGESRVSIEVNEFLTLIRTLEQQVAGLTQQLAESQKQAGRWEHQAALWYAWAGSPRDARKTIGKYPETRWPPDVDFHAYSGDPKVHDDYYLQTGKPTDPSAHEEEKS